MTRPPSPWAPVVVWGTIAAGALVLLASLAATVGSASWSQLVPFLVLIVLSESLTVDAYAAQQERISLSFAVAAVMLGVTAMPQSAALLAVSAGLTRALVSRQRRIDKNLFNIANLALASGTASQVYIGLRSPTTDLNAWTLFATLAAVAVYHLVNLGLVSLVVSLHAGQAFRDVVRGSAWYAPNKLALGLIGGCSGLVYQHLGLAGTALFALPLGILRYTLTMYAHQTRRTIATLEHQARHDPLTGLPNRLLLRERLDAALATATPTRESFGALLLLDLDSFKEVNDTFGHQVGDDLLARLGLRFQGHLPSAITIARLGGDEFGILVPGAIADDAQSVARELLARLAEPVLLEGQRLHVAASVGVALYPQDGVDPDTLLRRADVAMYVAKRAQTGFALYSPSQDEHTPERLALVGELRQAIEQDELLLEYQPQVTQRTGQVTSVEALVRWPHPRRGLVAPGEFISIAEHAGLIEPLTRCVLNSALRQCRAWLDAGRDLSVSVNVSIRDLHLGFPEFVAELLATHRVDARYLRLEITEGSVMADPARALQVLGELRFLGVGISVDDYGTGYSSLAYLGRLPADELKIDRAFVSDMRRNVRHQAIVRSTIALGHELGLVVVAEGVEDQATWDLLAAFDCDLIQGYLASKPLPAPELGRWQDEWTSVREQVGSAA